MSLEINPQEIIKLMLQYLKENNLTKSFLTLQEESKVALNVVDHVDEFSADILQGRWDSVLKVVRTLRLPAEKLMELYEQIIYELLEVGEKDIASVIAKETLAQNGLKAQFPEKWSKLDRLSQKDKFDPRDAYHHDSSKEKRRAEIADKILSELAVVPQHRLLSLMGQLVKYLQKDGLIPPNTQYNIFTGKAPPMEDDIDEPPKKLERTLRYGEAARIEIAKFSPDGSYLATGAIDGIIEVLDPSTAKLKTDLSYQAEEQFMLHKDTVTALEFSSDSELLASGSKKGEIKVWRVTNGNCLKKFEGVHSTSITVLQFMKENSHVLSAAQKIKIHGLRSGNQLKEFKGHDASINDVLYLPESGKLVSGGSDGYVKIWDFKSTECLLKLRPPNERPGSELDIYSLLPMPGVGEKYFLVCFRYPIIHLMTQDGKSVKQFKGDRADANFMGAWVSPKGKYLYALGSNREVTCFDTKSCTIAQTFPVAGDEMLGFAHHPKRNIMIFYDFNGSMMIYKP